MKHVAFDWTVCAGQGTGLAQNGLGTRSGALSVSSAQVCKTADDKMYLLFGLIGATIGGVTAKRRKGRAADIAQYAAAYGILFTILGLMLTIFVERVLI